MQIYYGPKTVYNSETSKVMGAQLRYVIYMPYATSVYWFTRNPDGFKSSLDYGTQHIAHYDFAPTEDKE
jgi:hypothetical protein